MVEITPSEIAKEHKKKEDKEFNSRFKRMDDDFKLWDMVEVKYEEGPTEINVTSNTPRTFADNVQTKLAAAERQISIRMAEKEGEDKRDDIAKLERLLEFAFEMADKRLVEMIFLTGSLRDYLIWTAIIRGWDAARILVRKSGKDVIFDFTPLDPRWLVFDVGGDGLTMTSYKTFRSKDDLYNTYGFEATGKEDSLPVYERWWNKSGKIWNAVVCGDTFLIKPALHKMPSLPVLIMPVATRPMVITGGEAKTERYGDSIYAPNRPIYPLSNKFASMWFTHAKLLYKQPLFNYYKQGGMTDIKDTILEPERIIDIPQETNEIVASPLKEISPTLVNAMNLVRMWEEQGSLPALELTSPPPSGTALGIIEEARSRIFGPQLRLLDRFYTAMCYMIEEQLLEGKIKVDVKSEIERKYYEVTVTPIDLKKPHIIKVEHTAETPWTKMASYNVAEMARRLGIPEGAVWEHILKWPDPKGLADLAAVEVAEHSPMFAMKRAVETLLKQGRGEDAQLMIDEFNRMMRQEQQEAEGGRVPPTG